MAAPSPPDRSGSSTGVVASFLLGATGVLAALLTALAASNGGVGRIELNERTTLLVGTICVIVSIAAGAAYLAVDGPRRPSARRSGPSRALGRATARLPAGNLVVGLFAHMGAPVVLLGGAALLVSGLSIAAYAAVTHASGRPEISATITRDSQLEAVVVSGEVTISDIPTSQHLEMRVKAFIPGRTPAGKERLFARAIYAASFGPNSSGDVKHEYEALLPRRTYQVLIEAWTGSYGYCFRSEIPKGTPQARIRNNLGCLRVRIPPALTAR